MRKKFIALMLTAATMSTIVAPSLKATNDANKLNNYSADQIEKINNAVSTVAKVAACSAAFTTSFVTSFGLTFFGFTYLLAENKGNTNRKKVSKFEKNMRSHELYLNDNDAVSYPTDKSTMVNDIRDILESKNPKVISLKKQSYLLNYIYKVYTVKNFSMEEISEALRSISCGVVITNSFADVLDCIISIKDHDKRESKFIEFFSGSYIDKLNKDYKTNGIINAGEEFVYNIKSEVSREKLLKSIENNECISLGVSDTDFLKRLPNTLENSGVCVKGRNGTETRVDEKNTYSNFNNGSMLHILKNRYDYLDFPESKGWSKKFNLLSSGSSEKIVWYINKGKNLIIELYEDEYGRRYKGAAFDISTGEQKLRGSCYYVKCSESELKQILCN